MNLPAIGDAFDDMMFTVAEGDITRYPVILKQRADKVYEIYYRKRVEIVQKARSELDHIQSLRSKS